MRALVRVTVVLGCFHTSNSDKKLCILYLLRILQSLWIPEIVVILPLSLVVFSQTLLDFDRLVHVWSILYIGVSGYIHRVP
jgi:hypothetical protein